MKAAYLRARKRKGRFPASAGLAPTRQPSAQSSRLGYEMMKASIETLRILGRAIAARDHDTASHDSRVTLYAMRLGEAAGLSDRALRRLMVGAFVHDVGKIAVPDRILRKEGPLSSEEWEIMKSHVLKGVEILVRCDGCGWMHAAIEVVRFHHERFDGSGYPSGCAGDDIPLNARIFAIADVFDALTTARPYKTQLSFDHAIRTMSALRNLHFDPRILDIFVRIAPGLYDRYWGEADAALERRLDGLIARYYAKSLPETFMPGCMTRLA